MFQISPMGGAQRNAHISDFSRQENPCLYDNLGNPLTKNNTLFPYVNVKLMSLSNRTTCHSEVTKNQRPKLPSLAVFRRSYQMEPKSLL